MKQQKMLNTNKGITLIALVITIIVMLILVAVTISMAVNGGLFGYAGKAGKETDNAIRDEQQLASGKIKIGDKWYASIDDYLNNNPIKVGIEINPEQITLKKKESEDVEGDEVLTGTITASVFGMESEPEITWEKSSDAITLSSTTGKSIKVTAVGTEKTEITVTAKCIYEGKEYTETGKVVLEILKPVINAKTMQSNLAQYLGKIVNYGVVYDDKCEDGNGAGKWEIFFADEEHIYLITKGHLATGVLSLTDKYGKAYNGSTDFIEENELENYPAVAQGLFNKTYDPDAEGTESDPYLKYSSTYINMKATQYLLDSRNWSLYVNEYADWAIGGPTQEIFVDSYNASSLSTTDKTLDFPSGMGYVTPFNNMGSVKKNTYLNCCTCTNTSPKYYWLACPYKGNAHDVSTVYMGLQYIERIGNNEDGYTAFRPLVCLDSNVKIILNEMTGEYDLSWNTN